MRFKDYLTKQGLVVVPSLAKLNEPFISDRDESYSFVPVFSRNWKNSDKRLLVILESVDRTDIREGTLLSNVTDNRGAVRNPITNALPALLDRATDMLDRWHDRELRGTDFSLCVANFNAAKSRDLPKDSQNAMNFKFAQRCIEIIRRVKPTHVLVCGDTATSQILRIVAPDAAERSLYKRGWVIPVLYEGQEFLLTPTLDLDVVCSPPAKDGEGDDDDDAGDRYAIADLLYFVARNAMNLLNGKHLYSLASKKAKPVVVRTVEEFNSLMRELKSTTNPIAVDSETQSLETWHNKIYTVQFSLDGKTGYIVPVDHPHESNPFSPQERRYIKKRLRSFFAEDRKERLKTLIFINGMFDLRVFRSLLGIHFIHHHIHEVTAGEALLDENIGVFGRSKWYYNGSWVRTSYQNLAAMYAMYENDHYFQESEFGKADRMNAGRMSLDNEAFIEYCATDTTSIWHIARMQFKRAKNTYVYTDFGSEPVSYYPIFKRHLMNIMQRVAVSISHMEGDGSPIDIAYLKKLMGSKSPLIAKISEMEDQFLSMPKVQEAEKLLLKDVGRSSSSLWGDSYSVNAFKISKKSHLEKLFFEVMKLEPVAYTPTGARSIGKPFTAAYAADHVEVKQYREYNQATKLLSTYVKGWYKKLMSSVDSAKDFILRPSFGFFTIVTGRLNSFDPSLQQVPSRGPMAPIIHEMFVSPAGHMGIQWDFNAAEVRKASVLSGDPAVADSFKVGQKLRRQLLKSPSDDIRKELKTKGDVHVLNVLRFFKQVVDKSHPLRAAVKNVVFGVIYGKSAKTLGRDLRSEALSGVMDKQRALRKNTDINDKERRKQQAVIDAEIKEIEERDWTEYAQDVMDKFFDASPKVKEWLEEAVQRARRYLHVISPAGRCRNLWRVLTGRPGVIAAASRRAQNSPIQGFSSESGSVAAYNSLSESYQYIKDCYERDQPEFSFRSVLDQLFPKYSRAVHDANYFYVPYAFVLPFVYITQHVSTLGLAEWYKQVFGIEFTIEPEIEFDIGVCDARSETWDWTTSNLVDAIFKALVDHANLDRLDANLIPETYAMILEPWTDRKKRRELNTRYPLLGVKNIDDQIELAIDRARENVRKWKADRKAKSNE